MAGHGHGHGHGGQMTPEQQKQMIEQDLRLVSFVPIILIK